MRIVQESVSVVVVDSQDGQWVIVASDAKWLNASACLVNALYVAPQEERRWCR
jgi:hypothetical protein